MKENIDSVGFTVCNVAYFESALVAANSFINNSERSDFFIFIFDERRDLCLGANQTRLNIVWSDSLQLENFGYLSFVYNVIELTTAYKPYLAMHLLKIGYTNVIFTDPDTYYLNGWHVLMEKLRNAKGTVLTPHYFGENLEQGTTEVKLLKFGYFNLGWFRVDSYSIPFLKWWWFRTRKFARNLTQNGEFTDQRWVETGFCRFSDKMSILEEYGCNVSYWNLFERKLSYKNNTYFVNELPLLMYHWSALNFSAQNKSKNYDKIDSLTITVLEDLSNEYRSEFRDTNYDKRYAYDYFNNGRKISDVLRQIWSIKLTYESYQNENLHETKSAPYKFARKFMLFGRKNTLETGKAPKIKRHQEILLHLIKRAILIIGYKRHNKISSLFVYLSNYKNYF